MQNLSLLEGWFRYCLIVTIAYGLRFVLNVLVSIKYEIRDLCFSPSLAFCVI